MRKIVFLAYHYPPVGGASVQRSVRFVRHLRDLGYQSAVVTGPGTALNRWVPVDETLAAEVPPETEVHRVAGPEPPPTTGWRVRAERWLRIPEPWSRWWIDGASAIGREALDEAELVYAWMQPYDSAEVAARLARGSGKPWIADLGDPWALDEMMIYPTGLHRRAELSRMGSLLATASAIVMSTPEAAARLRRRFPELTRTPVLSISNGFEPGDFEGPVPRRDEGTFRIVHTGYLHTQLGRQQRQTARARRALGGAVRGVDILTRSHLGLLEAIDRLVARDPSLAPAIELHLAGVLSAVDRATVAGRSFVRLPGYLPHGETVALMRSADLLFLPMHDLPLGARATIVPGKTYEYLASERPILAAVPDGDARDLLEAAGSAFLCRPGDVAGMEEILGRQIRRIRAREPGPAPDPSILSRYAYPRLAADLASVFDAVLASRAPDSVPAVTGRAA